MSTELIRIEPPLATDAGVTRLEAVTATLRAKPHLALLAAPAVLVGAPAAVIMGGVAAAAASTGALEVRDRNRRRVEGITLMPFSEAAGMADISGAGLKVGKVYARHPKSARSDRLILAKDLHAFVVREQIAEIIQFMRSRLHLKSLKLAVRSSQSGRFFAGGALQAIPFSAKLTGRRSESYAVEWSSHKPIRMDDERELVWINDFPEIVAAAENARHGKMKVSQSTDLSFDIETKAAKVAKVDAGWLATFEFSVEAEFS